MLISTDNGAHRSSPPIRVLFVTPYVPSRLRTRPYHFIKHLAACGHKPTVFALALSHRDLEHAAELERYCERVETVPVPALRSLWNCVQALGTGAPLQARYAYTPAMTALLQRALAGAAPCDVVHVEHLRAALFGLQLGTGAPCVFDAVDCISRLHAETLCNGTTPGSRFNARVDLQRTRRFERGLVDRFARVLISSAADRTALAQLAGSASTAAGARIQVLPNGVDLEYFQPDAAPRDAASLVFVGRMSYHANVTAVHHLVERVMPHVWARHPETTLAIVGASPSRSVRALAAAHSPRVRVTGTVDDVRPYLARATVSVSPLVYAVGIQNKVLEAMACATPVVTTPVAAAALQAVDGTHLLIADDAASFAERVVQLLDDATLRQRIGLGGRRYVETHHSWHAAARALEQTYREAIAAARAGAPRALAAQAATL